jgi:DNA replication protein DnaD
LNDSFAHVKRELVVTQYRNEMMDFMWSAFRKVAGINNRKTSENEDEKTETEITNNHNGVPLAKMDIDEL